MGTLTFLRILTTEKSSSKSKIKEQRMLTNIHYGWLRWHGMFKRLKWQSFRLLRFTHLTSIALSIITWSVLKIRWNWLNCREKSPDSMMTIWHSKWDVSNLKMILKLKGEEIQKVSKRILSLSRYTYSMNIKSKRQGRRSNYLKRKRSALSYSFNLTKSTIKICSWDRIWILQSRELVSLSGITWFKQRKILKWAKNLTSSR